ncbi:hypothetical protein [uncultured Rikenella sp.]|uniref:hypothetical protein n=1 Tax=uncultured Rikenella sp. TaxID=368003 RepID=UPI0025DD867C|nr:hypothetical protein [uncultured Rikenella sp.]
MIYEIHPCTAAEKGKLKHFIDCHWKKGHALAVSDTLLDFQHRAEDGSYHFLVARNTVSGEIDGVFGYIPLASDPGTYYGALWKVRDDITNDEIKLLGVFLWKRITKLPNFKTYAVSGISSIAKQFYQAAKLTLGYLHQYYILNDTINDYRIAQIPANVRKKAATRDKNRTVRIATVDHRAAETIRYPYHPVKNIGYLQTRYSGHPVYQYDFKGIFVNEELQTILITRTVEAQEARCIRIVDIYGAVEKLPRIDDAIQQLLQDENAEYIDCLNYGIDPIHFHRIGFEELDPDNSQLIIPNYFESFVQKNVRLECAHTPTDHQFVIFKGDGDQDRPNVLPARI